MTFFESEPHTWTVKSDGSTDLFGRKTKCQICREELKTSRKRHYEETHFQDGVSKPCTQCNAGNPGVFKNVNSYVRHAQSHHNWACNWPDCMSPTFRSRDLVMEHISEAHKKTVKCFRCHAGVLVRNHRLHRCKTADIKTQEDPLPSDDDLVDWMPRERKSLTQSNPTELIQMSSLESSSEQNAAVNSETGTNLTGSNGDSIKSKSESKSHKKQSSDEDLKERTSGSKPEDSDHEISKNTNTQVETEYTDDLNSTPRDGFEPMRVRRKFHFSPIRNVENIARHQMSSSENEDGAEKSQNGKAKVREITYKCKRCKAQHAKLKDHIVHEGECNIDKVESTSVILSDLVEKVAIVAQRVEKLEKRLHQLIRCEKKPTPHETKSVTHRMGKEISTKAKELRILCATTRKLKDKGDFCKEEYNDIIHQELKISFLQESLSGIEKKLVIVEQIATLS